MAKIHMTALIEHRRITLVEGVVKSSGFTLPKLYWIADDNVYYYVSRENTLDKDDWYDRVANAVMNHAQGLNIPVLSIRSTLNRQQKITEVHKNQLKLF